MLIEGTNCIRRRIVGRVAVGIAVCLFVLLVCLRDVEARIDTALLEFGGDLAMFVESDPQPRRTAISFNGQRLTMRVSRTETKIEALIAVYQKRCGSELPSLEHVQGREGYFACLRGNRELSLLDRTSAFLRTGDIGELGVLDYAYLRETDAGTQVISVRAGKGVVLSNLFPKTGDSPGEDVSGIPRPPSGRRVFSGGASDARGAIAVYANVLQPAPELLEYYRRELQAAGFRLYGRELEGQHRTVVVKSENSLVVVKVASEGPAQMVTVVRVEDQ